MFIFLSSLTGKENLKRASDDVTEASKKLKESNEVDDDIICLD
jgi:hypothetical protein